MLDIEGNPTIKIAKTDWYYQFQIPLLGAKASDINLWLAREPVYTIYEEKKAGISGYTNNKLHIKVARVLKENYTFGIYGGDENNIVYQDTDLYLVLDLAEYEDVCVDLLDHSVVPQDFSDHFFSRYAQFPLPGIAVKFVDNLLSVYVAKNKKNDWINFYIKENVNE